MDEVLTEDQWQAAVQALGAEAADAWRQRSGLRVEGIDAELPAMVADEDPSLRPNFKLGEESGGALGGDPSLSVADRGLASLYGDMGQAQERARGARLQLLQEATQALQQRRMGPDTAEKLYSISAALFAPTRTKGFSGMMGNLMPVAQQMRKTDREGEQSRQDALLSLRQKYQTAESESDVDAIRNKINLYKASRTGSGMQVTSDPFGRRFNTKTGFDIPNGAQIQALIQNPTKAAGFDIEFGPGASARVLAEYGGR